MTGGVRDGDERFELLSGRRVVVERAVASVAEDTPGLDLRRGVAVQELLSGPTAVRAYRTSPACGPRTARSCGPTWSSTAAGAVPPCRRGWRRWGPALRWTRSRTAASSTWRGTSALETGSCPLPWARCSSPTGPSPCSPCRRTTARGRSPSSPDRATGRSSGSKMWRGGRRRCGHCPPSPTGSTVTPLKTGSSRWPKFEDRHPGPAARRGAGGHGHLGRGGRLGVHQSLGRKRGVDRDAPCPDVARHLRHTGPDHPGELSEAFAVATTDTVEPWYKSTLAFDRHRLAEMAAEAEGWPYEPDDPAYEIAGRSTSPADGIRTCSGAFSTSSGCSTSPGTSWRDRDCSRRSSSSAPTGARRSRSVRTGTSSSPWPAS